MAKYFELKQDPRAPFSQLYAKISEVAVGKIQRNEFHNATWVGINVAVFADYFRAAVLH